MKLAPMIAVVTQPTRLRGLKARWATAGAAKFRLRQARAQQLAHEPHVASRHGTALAAADFDEYEEEDRTYQETLARLRHELEMGYPVKLVDRSFLPNFNFGSCVTVVVLGRDGLVANAAKYVGDLPIVAINPDPKRIDGVLLPFEVRHARNVVRRTLEEKSATRRITLAEVHLNDGQGMLAFNDFFVGCNSHASARYTLRTAQASEPQSSSGLIISTGAGSTGWLSSLFNMAEGFTTWLGGRRQPRLELSWEDRRLVWAVREPFRSKHSGVDMVAGLLEEHETLWVESLMPSGGVIFSDGIESDFLEFHSGTIAQFAVSTRCARLVVA